MEDSRSDYELVLVSAGNIIAVSAVMGSEIDGDDRYEAVREAWHRELSIVTDQLDRITENLASFGEAYDSPRPSED